MNIKDNQLESANVLHKSLNKIVPELLKELAKGFTLKIDGSFDKRTRARLDPLMAELRNNKTHRSYFDDSYIYSKYLTADTHYKTGEFSVNYFKVSVSLLVKQNEKYEVCKFSQLPIYSVSEANKTRKAIANLENQIESIDDKMRVLKNTLPNNGEVRS